jgi:hypothetical protein
MESCRHGSCGFEGNILVAVLIDGSGPALIMRGRERTTHGLISIRSGVDRIQNLCEYAVRCSCALTSRTSTLGSPKNCCIRRISPNNADSGERGCTVSSLLPVLTTAYANMESFATFQQACLLDSRWNISQRMTCWKSVTRVRIRLTTDHGPSHCSFY